MTVVPATVLEYLNKEPNLVVLTVAGTSSAQDVNQADERAAREVERSASLKNSGAEHT